MSHPIKVLVIGSGGREHALSWKLAQSPRVAEVLVAPGNAGTAREAGCRNVDIAVEDVAGLLALAQREKVDFTVVGPEAPLALGVVDTFEAAGLRVFGPRRNAAQLEASKAAWISRAVVEQMAFRRSGRLIVISVTPSSPAWTVMRW